MRLSAQALYSALLSDLSNEIDVSLPGYATDSTITQVQCYILRDTLLKKFNAADEPSPSACSAALEKFLAVNKRCMSWSIPLEFSIDELLLGEIKSALYDFWYTTEGPIISSFNQLFEAGRAGPGASVGARACDFYTKMFDSPLSGTGDLTFVWGRVTGAHELFREAEADRSKRWPVRVVECSHTSFVNKNVDIARGICTEPPLNMWFQQAFGRILDWRMKRSFNYDSELQPDINRVLARRGSMDQSLVTIDLSSASDSMALCVLQEILPRDFFSWLKLLRCPKTKLPNGEQVELGMVSTMGNGFTFPLQTLLFHCVVKAAYRLLGIPFITTPFPGECEDPRVIRRNVSVFGDDIIADARASRLLLRGLYLLGFEVNADKTFVEGPFRESCGADYIHGENVRGVYLKSLNTEQDLFVAINTLNRWTAKTGVSLPDTISLLLSKLRDPLRSVVPPDEDDAAGIHVPVCMLDSRSNPLVSKFHWYKGEYVNTHVVLRPYYAWVPRDVALELTTMGLFTPQGEKRRNYNQTGLLIAGLLGYIRRGRILLRQRKTTYRRRLKHTPSWGWALRRPHEYPLGYSGDRRFVNACARNLVGFGL